MEQHEVSGGLTQSAAAASCIAMAVFYVAILYSPTLLLRLPPADSFKSFMIRRFICAAISSVVSLFFCSLLLPVKRWDTSELLGVYGIRSDHIWQALVFPLLLTSLMYTGSFALKLLSMVQASCDHLNSNRDLSHVCVKSTFVEFFNKMVSLTSSVSSWRNYFVAPLTEELVFRACMIPLLLCGGFSTYTVIFLCPIFFSLAHLNHFLEVYIQQRCSLLKASAVVGFQLGYTIIFGAYASFLLIRSGHLTAPLIAHVFCNFMGLPVIVSRRSGIVAVASVAGMLGFFWMLFPLTSPHLYNSRTEHCKCWQRQCGWKLWWNDQITYDDYRVYKSIKKIAEEDPNDFLHAVGTHSTGAS